MLYRLLLLGMITVVPVARAATPSDICRTRSADLLAALGKGDYATATAHFDARMRGALDAGKLGQVWHDMLPAQFGAFTRAGEAGSGDEQGMTQVTTPLQFAHGWLDMQVYCNADGSIGGLFFKPGTAPATATSTGAVAATQANNVPLATPSPLGPLPGTLMLPDGDGPFPAVLLVAGSGPQDRDETIGGNKPFLDIATALAAQGIASYRYDKRTLVHGAAMAGKDIGVDDEVTDDAVTALQLLARQPRIDARRVFVLGHSLGGLMVPRIAERDPQLAGLILLSAPVALDLDVVLRQMRYIAGLQGAAKADLDSQIASIGAARDTIAHADPRHPPSGMFFHAPASYWLNLRDYRPIPVAKKLPQPMLIVQGGSDYQVTPVDDYAQWQAAFAHDPRVTMKLYPGLGHLLMPAGDPPSPADYQRTGHVDARVLDAITAWIKQQTQ